MILIENRYHLTTRDFAAQWIFCRKCMDVFGPMRQTAINLTLANSRGGLQQQFAKRISAAVSKQMDLSSYGVRLCGV